MGRRLATDPNNGQSVANAPTVLVIDTDRAVRRQIEAALSGSQPLQVLSAATPEDALAAMDRHPALALIGLPAADGLALFHQLRQRQAQLPVIFLTSTSDCDLAIEAMKLGADDVLPKPLSTDELCHAVRLALDCRVQAAGLAAVGQGEAGFTANDAFLGKSTVMQEVFKAIGRVASQDATVLIRGETGTGKELVARAIYDHSQRREQIFMAVNCAAIPESLLESELFGHERGAFTGANERRIGRFEQCTAGTLFLDEIGDMSALAQTKVLRVLQSQEFERVGGNETIKTNARLLAATNRDLEQLVADGTFRSDLYYRLQGFCVKLPPLRERGDDIRLLIDRFIRKFNQELDRELCGVAPDALEVLTTYSWPGNVRELQCMLRQAMLASTGPVIQLAAIPETVRNSSKRTSNMADIHSGGILGYIDRRLRQGSTDLYAESLELLERELLARVLRTTGGNQLQAARILGISRASLRNKIRTLGLSICRNISSSNSRHRAAH